MYALAALLLFATFHAGSPRDENADATAIRRAIDNFIAAYNAGDVDRLLRVYSDDFVDMSQGEPTLTGRKAHDDTAARLRDTFARFRPHLEVQTEEVEVFGSRAFDRGTLTVTLTPKAGGAPVVVKRRFLEIWRKESNGEWKVLRAMDNSDAGKQDAKLDFRSQ